MRKSSILVLGVSLLGFGLGGVAKADQVPGSQPVKIQAEIQSRLQRDVDLKNNHVQVTVDNGVVALKGRVDTEEERAKAGRLAMIKGVVQVDNQLEVGSADVKAAINDASITARLRTELLAEDQLRPVRVETNNAVVTLSGTLTSESAHKRALDLARTLEGVSRIEDNIRVVPLTSP